MQNYKLTSEQKTLARDLAQHARNKCSVHIADVIDLIDPSEPAALLLITTTITNVIHMIMVDASASLASVTEEGRPLLREGPDGKPVIIDGKAFVAITNKIAINLCHGIIKQAENYDDKHSY